MRRRKRTVKDYINARSILGCLLLLLSITFFLALFGIPENSLGVFFNKVQIYLMGKCAFLTPVIMFIVGVKVCFFASGIVFNNNTFRFSLLTLCLIGTAHHVFVPFGEELLPENLPLGGGLLGAVLIKTLHGSVGSFGTGAILGLGWLILGYQIFPMIKIRDLLKKIFAKKQKKNNNTAAENLQIDSRQTTGTVNFQFKKDLQPQKSVYDQEEFASFTEGLKKENAFRKILKIGNKPVYDKTQVEKDPVQLPEWQETDTNVIIRPIINYDGDDVPAQMPRHHFLDAYSEAEPEPINIPKPSFLVPQTEPKQTIKLPEQETEVVEKQITIFDSAEKVYDREGNADTAISDTESFTAEKDAPAAGQPAYLLPPLDILDVPKYIDHGLYENDIRRQCGILEQTLADFKVKAQVIAVTRGPSVTRFELEPAPGVKVSSVVNLADDIALKLAASGVRIEAPIPGKAAIGIEVPNIKNDPVYFREVVDTDIVRSQKSKLCIGLGKNISGDIIPADLSKMPHLLVAGSTGSGKSVCINTIIAGILYKATPDEVKLILVDPKVVELSNYNGIPHLLTPVVTDAKKAASALHWAVAEMERRYQAFADNHVREINSYNAKAQEKMPFIVIIIDELADLMMVAKVDVEDAILRLAQKARAAGIHLILATQRPSVDVITGIVKANIPSRIAFAVSSQTDSRTILDMGGAEKLLGKGDMLFYPIGQNKPIRVQGAFVSDGELNNIVDFIIKQSIPVNYSDEVTAQVLESDKKSKDAGQSDDGNALTDDDLFKDAVRLVLDMGQASSSMLQRRFRIGYTRAARLVDCMEELGIVGQSVGSKPREVIMPREEVEERFLNRE